MSTKRQAYQDELREALPALWERCGGICEVCEDGPAEHPHHRLMRSHGGTNDHGNLLAVCHLCHRTIHDCPTWAYEMGYLIRGNTVDNLSRNRGE